METTFDVRDNAPDITAINVLNARLEKENQSIFIFDVTLTGISIDEIIKLLQFEPKGPTTSYGVTQDPRGISRKGIYQKQVVEYGRAVYINPNNIIQFTQRHEYNEKKNTVKPNLVDISFLGNDSVLCNKLLNILNQVIPPPKENEGNISVLIQTQGGLDMVSVGQAAAEWVPDNYTESTVKSLEFVVQELNKENPAGRIVILDGTPGTGKTWSVRALVSQIPKSNFIIIPANMVSSLGDPSFMGFFIGANHLHDMPMTLVIEDADYCLVPREADNISAISTLLNMTDGIVGQMLDIRVIATTNVAIENVDEAIMRPGRLLKQISFNALEPSHANRIYRRITGNDGAFTEPKTLAEIYTAAKISDPVQPKKKSAKMGF